MADETYTASQKPESPAKISSEIKNAVLELQRAFPDQDIKALYWNKNYIAIPLEIEIHLPTRGPVGDIDIRKQEPIFLLLHRLHYPHKAPSAWSNRKDFPAPQLPHLNPKPSGSPPNFCLHRGNLNNWFAEHTIVDFVQRVRSWLRDAARDRLIRREDGFEFTRITDSLGYTIYEPSKFTQLIYAAWRNNNLASGFQFLWYNLLKNPSKDPLLRKDTYATRLLCTLPIENTIPPLGLSLKVNDHHTEENRIERLLFGLLAWPGKKHICSRYFSEIPDRLGDFIPWCEGFGIPLESALQTYLSKSLHLLAGVPITIAIYRPQRVIGTRSRLELLNFVINAGGDHWPNEGQWDYDSKVSQMGHRVPLTQSRARDISSQPVEIDYGPLLFLGCGAIGSKLILHLAKSGQTNMTLVDYDEISPHNLVRHALLNESTGRNKAEALKEVIQGIFYADKSIKIETYKESALNLLVHQDGQVQEKLKEHSWLIDTTASSMILNALVKATLPETLSCCRCEIADEGHLGLLSIEGSGRNPRLDDLQVLLFDMAIENPKLSWWLQRNREQREQQIGSVLEEIAIGISCSSETMRLADDLVSLHAASFSNGFRKCERDGISNGAGRIQVSSYSKEGSLPSIVEHIDILSMTIIDSRNDSSWQVRLKNGLIEKMKELLHRAKPNETGGLLIGMVNFKRKIIYVTRMLPASPDSVSSPYAFVRGIQDVPESLLRVQESTGGMLGYVGEWHTHPTGGPELSPIDKDAVSKIRRNLDSIPLPTHIMIVTSRGLYPHIYSP